MAEHHSLICITCPMGCKLEVQFDPERGQVLGIEGNGCRRAELYAEGELTHPTRMVTTTVQVSGGVWPSVPVHTADPIPKSAIFALLRELRSVMIDAPVRCDQLVLANGAGTGVDVLASRDLPVMSGLGNGDPPGAETLRYCARSEAQDMRRQLNQDSVGGKT
jgi:CxxC motif-containing protein